jgi:hypothetical protein
MQLTVAPFKEPLLPFGAAGWNGNKGEQEAIKHLDTEAARFSRLARGAPTIDSCGIVLAAMAN